MSTMNKSHLSRANNSHPVVTPHDIGSFVKVAGVGTGILRYVGSIHGKDGLFCGIELDLAIGKHNGVYQGVSYFTCPPERGIFAPLYKVELDDPDDVPMLSLAELSKGQERLSRSALPALQLKNVARPEDPMTASIFTNASAMDSSLLSQVSWGDITDMCASNTTYVIPPGKGMFDEEDDLMTVEAPQSVINVDRDAIRREEERLLGTSYVVENPRFTKERLPVVEDDEDDPDLVTPMVELQPSEGSWNVSMDSEVNQMSSSNQENIEEVVVQQKEMSNQQKIMSPQVKMSENLEKKPVKEKEVVLQPKFPVKPKAPSKHQLMMQQLKASIEADKNKPKKEVKARVPLIPPPPPSKQKENEEDKMVSETPKRVIKQPLKAVNEKPKAERPKKERKPLYVPPPPKERKEAPTKPVITPSPRISTQASSKESINSEKKEIKPKMTSQFPTSSFAGGKSKTTSAGAIKSKKKIIDENEKLSRLLTASSASVALALTVQTISAHKKDLQNKLNAISSILANEQKTTESLRNRLQQVEKNHQENVERIKASQEQVTRSHAETVEKLKKNHETQFLEKTKEAEKSIEDERHRHQAEMEAMSRRHQKVIVALDEKIAESEKLAEQLKVDKKSLQQALANDSDQRNQMLTKEINSLQTALELKSNEMKELRQKYQQVALRVEEIPLKELEIAKLKHKVTELKQSLDQKITYERLLVNQNEDLKRQQQLIEEEKDSMQRSMEVMKYHYENGDDPMTSSKTSSINTPSRVTFRSRSSNSSHRPHSGIPPEARLSMSSCGGDMERSLDRDSLTRSTISMYASQYKLPENHAEDVIYAPDEIITGGVTNRQLSNDSLLHVNGNETDPQTDSGIVLS